jgi:hypothetical protein
MTTRNMSMSRFTFNLATPADDAALCDLLAATPMEGAVSLAFTRCPSYFAAAQVEGQQVQVGVVRDGESQRVVGMGLRAISSRYVGGKPASVGYLSGLRLMRAFRGSAGLLARGYRFLRELHQDGAACFYLTTVAADNPVGRVLTSARAGLPVYHSCGDYHTLAISTSRFARNGIRRDSAVEIRPAEETDRDAIIAFLKEFGPTRQFFPVYERQDLFSGRGLLKGLRPSDVLLAICGTQIIGTIGCWDQRAFRQIVVDHYSPWLAALRPVYNAWASLRQQPALPAAGLMLPAGLAAIPVVRDDNQQIFRQLLGMLSHRLAQRGNRLLLVGLHSADPLLAVAQRFAGRDYVTKLYIVYWPGEAPDIDNLLKRAPYLELGSL